MQRTDILANRTNILIVFLIICFLLALFGKQSSEDQIISERFEPEVTESEIRYYLENEINYNDSDQFGFQTIQDWLPIQSELAQLNLALEYFSRLNLEKILNKHPELEELVNECLDLKINQEFEIFMNQLNQSQQNQTTNQDSLVYYTQLLEKKKKLNEEIFKKKAEYDGLLNGEKDQKQNCIYNEVTEFETIKLNKKQTLFGNITEEIQKLQQSIYDLNKKLQSYKMQEGDQEDLTEEYQKDQELAKHMSKLFKPAGKKLVEIRDEKLEGILNIIDVNMKQYNTSEVYINGLNYHRENQKFYIDEIEQNIQRNRTNLEYKTKDRENLQKEIEQIQNSIKEKNENYKNATQQLEEIRRKKAELSQLIEDQKKELNEVIYEIKNYNPQKNLQNNNQLDAQKKFKEYLYEHLKLDQICVERCIEYNSLNQQITTGRYQISLNSIQKHFKQLEQKFKEFNYNLMKDIHKN